MLRKMGSVIEIRMEDLALRNGDQDGRPQPQGVATGRNTHRSGIRSTRVSPKAIEFCDEKESTQHGSASDVSGR